MMKNLDSGIVPLDNSSIYRIGFWAYGGKPIVIKHVFATSKNPYDNTAAERPNATENMPLSVYNIAGCKVADYSSCTDLSSGLYIIGSKKIIVR